MTETILIASDHRGFPLKAKLLAWMKTHDYEPRDLGTNGEDRCDASDFANVMAREISGGKAHRGILICGTGQAMAMTANRYRAIRAALCVEPTTARLTRQQFLGGRYAERLTKLDALGGL
jgi:ribose 5-phosphate isomerase B